MPDQLTCPVCYSTQTKRIYTVSSLDAAKYFCGLDDDDRRLVVLDACIQRIWGADRCDFIRCEDCSYCFAFPYVAGNKEFYSLFYSDADQYETWKWEYEMTYQTLRRYDKINWLLEIGAGNGAFLKRMSPELISKDQVLCTEYSDYGLGEIQRYGIRCLPLDIRDLVPLYKGCFDVVCMFQVLEHLSHIDDYFDALNMITSQQANLFIAVPNPKERELYDRHGFIEDIPPVHIGRWNRRSIEVIAYRHNWSVVQCEVEPRGIAWKIERFVRFRFTRDRLARRVGRIPISLLRKPAKAVLFGLHALFSVPSLTELLSRDLGNSQWMYLRKRGG